MFVSAKGKDKSTAKRAEQRRNASHPLEQTTGCSISQGADFGIVSDKYLLKHPSNFNKWNLFGSQCNVSLDRGRKPHPLKGLLTVLEHLLLTEKNVFSQWAELGGCGAALIQTQGGNIQAAPSMSQETQPLATFIGLGSVCAEGLLGWSFCVLLLHLEGVSLSAKSTLVTPKSLCWQITDPLLAGRRMRVRTLLVWVSNSVLRNHFQTVTELPDLLMDV